MAENFDIKLMGDVTLDLKKLVLLLLVMRHDMQSRLLEISLASLDLRYRWEKK